MATEAQVIADLLAKHPSRLAERTNMLWNSDSTFPGLEFKHVHVMAVLGTAVRPLKYTLYRTSGDPNSVRVEGGVLATDEEKGRIQLFREKVAALAADLYLDPGANGHRGARIMVQNDSPSGWLEVIPLASDTPVHRFCWLKADNTLGFSANPVDLSTVAPHLLR